MSTALIKRTKGEEIANSVSHGIGVGLAIAGTVLLIVRAAMHGTAWHVVSYSIFGAGMILLYTASTLFHGVYAPRLKFKLNKFDHSSIYILIAATYTPITLTALRGAFGWVIFGLIWGLAIAGVVFKIWFYTPKYRMLSTILYVVMGWMILIAIVPVIRNVHAPSIWLLLAGCLSYTISPVFYLLRKVPYAHAIFHIFILGGTICHFFGIYYL
jgi:hemolysin III